MAAELRPYSAWHEEDGDVLWWRFPVVAPPYVGSPLDCGRTVKIEANEKRWSLGEMTIDFGGWPFLDCEDGTLFWQCIEAPEDPRSD